MTIHRWWGGPHVADPLWDHPDIVDHDFDVTELPWYQPGRVHPVREWQHRANIARLHLLYEHGGWWVDHDVQIHVPLDGLPFPMTAGHGPGLRCNCVMGFPAGHPDLRRCLDIIAAAPPSQNPATIVSGERLLSCLLPLSVAAVLLPLTPSGKSTGAPRWVTHRFDTSARHRVMSPRHRTMEAP